MPEGVKFDYNMEFDKNKGGDGKEYIKTKSSKLDLSPDVTHYKLDNLFNGDAKLGKFLGKVCRFSCSFALQGTK